MIDMSTPPEATPRPTLCYGCKHLRSRWFGDGTMQYGCALTPGLVLGSVSAFEQDEPHSCEEYQRNDH